MIDIYNKIKNKGVKWLAFRAIQEMRNPQLNTSKKIIDLVLKIIDKSKKRESEYIYAIYDLNIAPITYNVVEYMCLLEFEVKERKKKGFVLTVVQREKKESKIKSDYDKIIDENSKEWRIENIIIPSALHHPLCKGIYYKPDDDILETILRTKEIYPKLYSKINIRYPNVEDLKIGFYDKATSFDSFVGIKAKKQGLKYIKKLIEDRKINKKIITIVIRDYEYDTIRNSNVKDWNKFAKYLIDNNYYPIIVPDTDQAFTNNFELDEKYIFREASWSVGLRLALYEQSLIVLCGPGGAGSIALFNKECKVIQFNTAPTGSIVSNRKTYLKAGVNIDNGFKFLNINQRMVVKNDTYENILNEFNDYVERLK